MPVRHSTCHVIRYEFLMSVQLKFSMFILAASNHDIGGFGTTDFEDLLNDSSFDKEKRMDPVVRLQHCDEDVPKRTNASSNCSTRRSQSGPDEEQQYQDSPSNHNHSRPKRPARGNSIIY